MRQQTLFLASVTLLLGYDATPLRPQSGKTSVKKTKSVVIVTLTTGLGKKIGINIGADA